jgi:two-component system NarL family response regulator
MTIRVALGDDHRMLRDALAGILDAEPDIEVVGTASDGEAIIELVRVQAPDVLVLDIAMPGMSGIDVARRLREMKVKVKILALSAYDDRRFVQEMLQAGAAGYLTKAGAATDLTRAIRDVAAGKTYLSSEASGVLVESLVGAAPGIDPPGSVLSVRERQVLQFVAEGMRSAAIAEHIGVAVATVEVHRRNIMRKLNMHTVAQLTRYAMREGMTKL